MAKCKMKQVALAVGTVLGGLSLLPSAQAVNLATDGLGQVLIFPYYTTRAGWNTLINITNTSDQVVVAKVRFHEGYNSRDVFDFNIVMSPYDVWNGTLANGAGDVPNFSTSDKTCTVPTIPSGGQTFTGLLAYTNGISQGGIDARDGGPTGTDRMREGYITVIMMGTAPATVGTLAYNALHTTGPNCAPLQGAFALSALSGYTMDTLRAAFPSYTVNPLKGAYSLVNAENGWNASSEAVTLANFFTPTTAGNVYQGANLITAQLPPDLVPQFTDSFQEPELSATNTVGQVLLANGTAVVDPTNAVGAGAVSYVLNRASVVNQWANLDASASSAWTVKSDWVVTFPTKRFYVDTATHQFSGRATQGGAGVNVTRPGLPASTVPFTAVYTAGKSCDSVQYQIYDREENKYTSSQGPVFSPAPSTPGNELCQEVNVLTFGSADSLTNVLKSPMGSGTLSGNVPETVLPGKNGWMQLDFTNTAGYLPVTNITVLNRTEPTGILNESFIVQGAYIRP